MYKHAFYFSIAMHKIKSMLIHQFLYSTPKGAWDELAKHLEDSTLSNKIHYRRKLYAARMYRGTNMVTHVNNIRTIAEHL